MGAFSFAAVSLVLANENEGQSPDFGNENLGQSSPSPHAVSLVLANEIEGLSPDFAPTLHSRDGVA